MAQSSTENKGDVDSNNTETVVYTWGTGRSGEVGHLNLDKSQKCLLPSPITFFAKKRIQIKAVACGEGYSCAISSDGNLYTWGLSYKLGINCSKDIQKEPVLVKYFVDNKEKISKVACGECHMGVITESGEIYLWGKSENGCVGDGIEKKHDVLLPYKLSIGNQDDKIYPIDIDLGWKASAVIMSDGSVYSWGCGSGKVLGHKDCQKNYCKPKRIKFITSSSANHDNDANEEKQADDVKIINISLGSHHAAAVSGDGDVYCWGNNSWYNLGLGNNKNKEAYCTPQLLKRSKYFNNEKVVSVSCTKSMLTPVKGPGKEGLHTMAITENGSLYCWGAGHKGKCANLTKKWGFHLKGDEDVKKPYKVGGRAYDSKKNVSTEYFKDTNIVQCVSGAIHSGVVDDEGKVYTFGCGSDGRMGLRAYVDGSCGAGKQVYKFYVSKPTIVEIFDELNINVKQIGSGRRHMIALGHLQKKEK